MDPTMTLRLIYACEDQACVDLGQGTISGDRGHVAKQVAMQVRTWILSHDMDAAHPTEDETLTYTRGA